MPDENPVPPEVPQEAAETPGTATPPDEPAPAVAEPVPPSPQYSFNIGEEFGTAKRNLPPAKIVLIALAVLVAVSTLYTLTHRTKPLGTGGIDDFTAISVPDQNLMLVAINVTLTNTGEKAMYVHTLKGMLKTDSGEFEDEPVSQVDYQRYFQAFPALGIHAQKALLPETKVMPGDSAHGTVLVSFPVSQDTFDKRKSLSVSIQPYDQALPVVLTK
jgi:hypothetical protein